METRLSAQIDNLVRDAAAMRGYLSKINEVVNDISEIETKMKDRPTKEEVTMEL